jgi:hypothetical protein
MNCSECCELLALYVDGSLTDAEMQKIKTHLDECHACLKECREYTEILDLVCKIKAVEAPVDFHSRFWCRFNNECKPFKFQGWWSAGMFSTVAAATAFLLCVIIYKPINELSIPGISQLPENEKAGKINSTSSFKKTSVDENLNLKLTSSKNIQFNRKNDMPSVINQIQPFQSMISPVSVGSAPVSGVNHNYSATNIPGDIKTLASEKLYRQEKEWSGDACAILQPSTFVLNNLVEAKQFWQKAEISSLPLPEINWNQSRLGVICLGNQMNSGYEIKISEISNTNNNILIKFRVISPRHLTAKSKTQPFLIFLFSASDKNCQFIRE